MQNISTYRRRKVRQLFSAIRAQADQTGAQTLLVTSVNPQAGKTRLMEAMRQEAHLVAPGEVAFVSGQFLDRLSPDDLAGEKLVLVDGAATVGSDGLLDVPHEWMRAFDGAVLVVVKRRTRRRELVEAQEWLDSSGIPITGVVWNEMVLSPFFVEWERFKARVRERLGNGARVPAPASAGGDDE